MRMIRCVNSKKEIINLCMKNMPDFDEMENIIQIGKKIQRMYRILLGFVAALMFTFIISCMWFVRPPAKSNLACVYMIVLYLVYVFYCISVKAIGMALERRIIVQQGCDYVWQYLETYSKARWDELLSHIKGYRTLLDIDFPKGTDDTNVNMDILFGKGKTFFVFFLPDRVCDIFWLDDIIRNPMLNENIVEFDFLKNELSVPMEFECDR